MNVEPASAKIDIAEPAMKDRPAETDDPLTACLEYVARELGKPFSRNAALAGLPLRDNRLTVDLVPRAAERIGLIARLVKRRIRHVPDLVMPYIVLFESGDAGVVTGKSAQTSRLEVVFPAVAPQTKTVTEQELERQASGFVFYVTSDDRAETASRGTTPSVSSGHWFWSVAARLLPSWMQIIVAALVINLLGLAVPIFVMNVYDRVIPNLAIPTLWVLVVGVAGALFCDFLLRMLRAIVLDRTGRRVDMHVAASLFEHAMAVTMARRPGSAGGIANQIREFENVRDFFTSSSIIAATDLLFIGVFVYVLWLIVGPIAYVPLIAVPIVLVATLLIQIPLARAVTLTQAHTSQRHSVLVEGLVGVETIKALAAEGVVQRKWEHAIAGTARANSASKFWTSLALYFTSWIQQAMSVVIIAWGVFLVADGSITIGGLIAANILAGRVLAPLGSIAHTLARAQGAIAAMRELNGFMQLPRDDQDAFADTRLVEHGGIDFRSVSYAYPGSDTEALKDLSFSIEPGERVGIVGRIGSGKTTIGKLVAGLYTCTAGSVLVSGADVRSYQTADLRAGVGFVAQDPELFSGSLRENIILGKTHASDEEIADVVRVSGVGDFASTHPLGLGMPLGERGAGLSGGQRQAVVIARMLLRNPRILFLDEPSGAMDTTTETALIRNLRARLSAEHTLIISTHRSSFLELVDRLLVIEAGRLVADGPKEDVLKALKNQSFRRDKAGRT